MTARKQPDPLGAKPMQKWEMDAYWARRANHLAREAKKLHDDLERILAELRLARAMAEPAERDTK